MHPNPEVRGEGQDTHVEGRIFYRQGLLLYTCYDTSTWWRRQGQRLEAPHGAPGHTQGLRGTAWQFCATLNPDCLDSHKCLNKH